jgi:hypothetical protein
MNPHDTPPRRTDDPPAEALAALHRIQSSDYFASIAPLQDRVVGRRITNSIVGHAGFLLMLDDETWVAVFLRHDCLQWAAASWSEGLPEQYLQAIDSPEYGDGREPLASGFFAEGICDIPAALAKAKGEVIEGLSFGENTFNFRLPGGRELETIIGPTKDGKLALRVFWEQW